MEKKFKLKKEARQFFDKKLHKEVGTIEYWSKNAVTIPLLDEVEMVYIEYGSFPKKISQDSTATSRNLCGHYGNKKQSHFEFTVHVNDIDWDGYHQINDDSFIAKWIDELQKTTDKLIKSKLI